MNKGIVLWFTGLPNSGKTTVSSLAAGKLESMGHDVERLDSDEVPRSLTKNLSADWTTRQIQKCTNLIFVGKLLSRHNVIVLIASVGRFQDMRNRARAEIPQFAEIYLKCPLDVRLKRDDKAKYQRNSDTIHYYEEPDNPEIVIESDKCTLDEAVGTVIRYLVEHGYIPEGERNKGSEHSLD